MLQVVIMDSPSSSGWAPLAVYHLVTLALMAISSLRQDVWASRLVKASLYCELEPGKSSVLRFPEAVLYTAVV